MSQDVKAFLKNKQAGGNSDEGPAPSHFDADDLICTITTPDGTVVLSCELAAKGFKPKQVKGKWVNTLGWQAMPKAARGDDEESTAGEYCGLPVTGNLMLYVGIGKVPAGEPFRLRPEADTDSDE
jgi:hypothetical protein